MEEHQGERRWIVEPPPAAGEVSLYLAVGEGVELTAEQEAALSELMRTLETSDAEVTGHAACTNKGGCGIYDCDRLGCTKVRCGALASGTSAVAGGAWSLMGTFSTGIQ